MTQKNSKTTHFGYQEVPIDEKVERVGNVFTSVASKYDIMNDLMSFGLHRCWKDIAINQLNPCRGDQVLDLAGGTGDLTFRILKKIGATGHVVLADINQAMLQQGRDRLLNKGITNQVTVMQVNAECLPFKNTFNRAIIGFGLRNVTDKDAALSSMYHSLKPGGKCVILEFSKPLFNPLSKLYDAYSFHLLPKIGAYVAGDADSYQYLAESIRMHPDQMTLKSMMETAGFEDCKVTNLAGGIVAIHSGYKY